MAGSFRWLGDKFVRLMNSKKESSMRKVVEIVKEEVVQSLSTPYPPASLPGEPPRRRTGELAASIVADVEIRGKEVVGIVGTTLERGLELERGTSNVAARPFLRPTMNRTLQKVRSIYRKG